MTCVGSTSILCETGGWNGFSSSTITASADSYTSYDCRRSPTEGENFLRQTAVLSYLQGQRAAAAGGDAWRMPLQRQEPLLLQGWAPHAMQAAVRVLSSHALRLLQLASPSEDSLTG